MKTKPLISTIVIIAIILFLINYIKNNIESFKQLTITNPLYLIPLIILFIIFLYTNGIILKVLMKPFNINIKTKEAFGLATITNFYNLITPLRGGAAARAVYLKKKHNFAYVNFLATLSAIYIIIFLISSLTGIISMLFILNKYQLFNKLIFALLSIITIVLLSIIIFSPKQKEVKNKWLNRFIKVINGWHLIKNDKKIIITTAIASIIQVAIATTQYLIVYHMFGIDIGITKALFISAISNLAILVAITPGNLGIGDAINVFSANIIGIPLTEAIAATILIRVVNLVIILILGPIFTYYLLKNETNTK